MSTRIIACTQSDVLGDGCPGCGGWLHRVQRDGFVGPGGMRFCDEECIADDYEHRRREHMRAHYGTRDLLCNCAEFCAPAGLPTVEMVREYEDYLATLVDGREPTP